MDIEQGLIRVVIFNPPILLNHSHFLINSITKFKILFSLNLINTIFSLSLLVIVY